MQPEMLRENKRLEAFAYCWADLLFEVDAEWVITYAAGATDVLLGAESGSLVGQRFADLMAPVDRPSLQQLRAGLEEWGRVHSNPLTFQGASGTLVELQVAAHSVMSRGRHFLSCRMLTRKEAERLRRRSTRTGLLDAQAFCRFEAGQSPFELIRFAEETGMAPELDLAVLRRVLEQVTAIPLNVEHQPVAVNVSGLSITNARFLAEAESLLRRYPVARDRILFEITESAKIGDLTVANAAIQQFRSLGFPVCLDDFGAGACSFQYLSGVDVDIVKLDGSAIRNARATPRGAAFLSALTQFCTSLGMEVVAEQIESREQVHFCVDNGCRFGQGFLFGRPDADLAVFRSRPNDTRRFPAKRQ